MSPSKRTGDGNELLLSATCWAPIADVVYRSMEENAERQMLFAGA